MPPPARRRHGRAFRRRRRGLALVFGLALLVALSGGAYAVFRQVVVSPFCTVTDSASSYLLTPTQARNAATIALVAKRLGMPDHAVTVALAAALQESKLQNLPSGDRDSVGLFQQRPSEGWGTPAELRDPVYAATAFFRALAKVPGWTALPVAQAAQDVQHSADGAAYADWSGQARALAVALSGESPQRFACQFSPAPPTRLPALAAAASAAQVSAVGGWVEADWLVANASAYGVTAVAYDGQQWSADSGHWAPGGPPGGPTVRGNDGHYATP